MAENEQRADECYVEIGGQRMTEAQYHAARFPLLHGVASITEGERMREVWGMSDWDGSEDSARCPAPAATAVAAILGMCHHSEHTDGCAACIDRRLAAQDLLTSLVTDAQIALLLDEEASR